MAAMGGSVEEARRYVDRMKKQTERENQAKRESDRRMSKNWYESNRNAKITTRIETYEANKEKEKAYFRDYHETNREPRKKYFAARYEDSIEEVIKRRMEVYEGNKEAKNLTVGSGFWKQYSQNTTFPQHERSECVGLSVCVKHCHVVPATNCCWLEFGCVHP